MTDFVEQCRTEWRRLGVPDPLADEMAADLTADLGEAEAEGVSVEELLGSSASDPRAFARSWAAERGLVPAGHRRPRFLVAFTALAAIALVVSALLLATGEPKVSLATSMAQRRAVPPAAVSVASGHVSASAATPIEWILLGLAVAALAFAAWLWASWARARPLEA